MRPGTVQPKDEAKYGAEVITEKPEGRKDSEVSAMKSCPQSGFIHGP